MVRRATLLLVGSLAAVTLLSACPEKSDRTQTIDRFIPTGRTALDLELEFPAGGGFTSTCSGAGSYLVSIDTNGQGTWQYQLLFDATRTLLYGCGTPADQCPPGTGLSAELPSIGRLMVEGLSVTPQAYVTSSGAIDIVCRGIADEAVVTGSITFASAPSPTPTSTPSYADTGTFTIRLKMLEVGASNPLPIGTGIVPTQRRFGAAASLSVPEHGIGLGFAGPKGRIAIAGGILSDDSLPTTVWEFDPQNLAFSVSAASLTAAGSGLAGLSATTYIGPGDAPAILFAGGSSDSDLQSLSALSWQPGSSFHHVMTTVRSFHGAAYLQRAGAVDPVIVLLGGMNFDDVTQTFGAGERADYAYFVPPDSEIGAPCQTAASPNGAFCIPTADTLGSARGFTASIPFFEGGGPKVWVVGGAQGGLARSETDGFDGSAAGIIDANGSAGGVTGAAGAVLTSSGQPLLNGLPLVFGGLLDPDLPNARDSAFRRLDVATTSGIGTNNMRIQRGALSAVTLRDRTVLLVGGRDDDVALVNGVATLEVFVPTADPALGEFRFVATPGGACDTTGVSTTGCPALVAPRWGHTATRLDETFTWLDGALLIAGGGGPSAYSAELFVPAYRCEDDSPISPITDAPAVPLSNPTLPELCDLGRLAVPITNPTAP